MLLAERAWGCKGGVYTLCSSACDAGPRAHAACMRCVQQVLVMVAGKGPSGHSLELRHGTRSKPEVMDEVRARRARLLPLCS